jgi:hypothetical protein
MQSLGLIIIIYYIIIIIIIIMNAWNGLITINFNIFQITDVIQQEREGMFRGKSITHSGMRRMETIILLHQEHFLPIFIVRKKN